MRTLNERWVEAFERAQRVPILVVTLTTSTGVTHRWISGDQLLPEQWPTATLGLASISASPSEIDPFSRSVSIGDWSLTFADEPRGVGRLRAVITGAVIRGKKIDIALGESSIVAADYEDVAAGMVVDSFAVEPGTITVQVLDPRGQLVDATTVPYQSPGHPFRVAYNLIRFFTPTGVLDAASFDEKDYESISHFVVSRHPWGATFPWLEAAESKDAISVREHAALLLSLCNAALFPAEDGTLSLAYYDRTSTPVRTFSTYEVSEFEANDDPHIDVTNAIDVVGRMVDGSDFTLYSGANADSKEKFAWPGESERAIPKKIPEQGAHPWLNSFQRVLNVGPATQLDATETSLAIWMPRYFGFSGTTIEDASGNEITPPTAPTQQTEHTINGTTRPAYFLLTDHGQDIQGGTRHTARFEIVKATSFAYDTGRGTQSVVLGETYWAWGIYTIERGALGTSPFAWDGAQRSNRLFVYDITIPVWLAEQRLDRFAFGAPRVAFTVPSRHADIQLGDAVALESVPRFLAYDSDGLDSNTVFEVISKEPRTGVANPGWRLTCSRIRKGEVASPLAVVVNLDWIPIATAVYPEPVTDSTGAIVTDSNSNVVYRG